MVDRPCTKYLFNLAQPHCF